MVRRLLENLLVDTRDAWVLLRNQIDLSIRGIRGFLSDDVIQMFAVFAILYLVMVLL